MNILTRARNWAASKAVEIVATTDWYERNGFYRLAAMKEGYDSTGLLSVSEQRALQIGTFFACVKVIGEDESSQPFVLHQKEPGSENHQDATDHPLYEILHDLANPDCSAQTFVETLTAHAAVCGTGYATISRRNGEITGLYPVLPGDIQRKKTARGRTYFQIRNRGQWDDIAREEVFDLPGFSWDGETGINVVRVAQQTLGLTVAQENYASGFFLRDGTPSVVLDHPGEPSDDAVAKIKEGWRKTVKSHDVAVLREGMKATVVGTTNTDSQLLEQRIQQVREVCKLFRISPHKVGDLERMTFSNVEQMQIDHKNNVLLPWNKRWRSAVYRCLLTPQERAQGFYAEMAVEVFMRGDFKTQTEGFRALLEKGVYSVNEVRAWYNMDPIEGGDIHLVQVNMQDIVNAATAAAMEAAGTPPQQLEATQ